MYLKFLNRGDDMGGDARPPAAEAHGNRSLISSETIGYSGEPLRLPFCAAQLILEHGAFFARLRRSFKGGEDAGRHCFA